MPLATVSIHEGQLDAAGKQRLIQLVTDALVEAEGLGEFSRQSTWVAIEEIPAGNFGVGGQVVDLTVFQHAIRQRQEAAKQQGR
jgi:4-oxalocrotonate tautomerase family enzyme